MKKLIERSIGAAVGLLLQPLLWWVRNHDFYWPTEASMRAVHRVVSFWAPELVITRGERPDLEILLAQYDGGIKEFAGRWHIPGGYNVWNQSIVATCGKIARREIGVELSYVDITLDIYKWRQDEHPYGRPLSVYIKCELGEEVTETSRLRYFRVSQLPIPMVEPHRRFIQKYLAA